MNINYLNAYVAQNSAMDMFLDIILVWMLSVVHVKIVLDPSKDICSRGCQCMGAWGR